jgi:Putative periplasmic protein kinase ArgK and related GTPases of G3E family
LTRSGGDSLTWKLPPAAGTTRLSTRAGNGRWHPGGPRPASWRSAMSSWSTRPTRGRCVEYRAWVAGD